MNFKHILNDAAQYYTQKIETYGPTARGTDWNSVETQVLRFEQLLKVVDKTGSFSINDYGCGYGALIDYLSDLSCVFQYRGFDIAEAMIIKAKTLHQHLDHCEFFTEESSLTVADYTIASGIFNVRQQTDLKVWRAYVLHTLEKISALSKKGFAFNILTSYSDKDRMSAHLYYADPCFFFDYCKTRFSRNVALLHDYGLYEFTMVVRK